MGHLYSVCFKEGRLELLVRQLEEVKRRTTTRFIPMPRMYQGVAVFGEGILFPTLSANCSYCQDEVSDADLDGTAFTSIIDYIDFRELHFGKVTHLAPFNEE